jgi:hypothetical protein
MAKKKSVDRAHVFTIDEIAAVERQLQLAGEVFADFRELAETTESKTLAAHNRLTLERAMGALESTVAAIQKAVQYFYDFLYRGLETNRRLKRKKLLGYR